MEIKEAVEILKNEQLDIFDGKYGRAFKTVIEAFKNGYTLCKVDEAVEKIRQKGVERFNLSDETYTAYCEGLADAQDIIKEACK